MKFLWTFINQLVFVCFVRPNQWERSGTYSAFTDKRTWHSAWRNTQLQMYYNEKFRSDPLRWAK